MSPPVDTDVSQVLREIEQEKLGIKAGYPSLWGRMIREWREPRDRVNCWLAYSGNYLFHTNGVRWAIDPPPIPRITDQDVPAGLRRDFEGVSFIVLTHRHADHYYLPVLRSLSDLRTRWVVPEFLTRVAMDEAGLPESHIVPAPFGEPVTIDGIELTAFPGLHWERDPESPDEIKAGVEAAGYLVECGGKRLLLPGDTRTYDVEGLPVHRGVDWVFAHLWLGRNCALQSEFSLLDPFCRFMLTPEPKAILLTHLWEVAREADSYWTRRHARLVEERFSQTAPRVRVATPGFGKRVIL